MCCVILQLTFALLYYVVYSRICKMYAVLDTEDASEGETGKKDREFTGIKEQYVIFSLYCLHCS